MKKEAAVAEVGVVVGKKRKGDGKEERRVGVERAIVHFISVCCGAKTLIVGNSRRSDLNGRVLNKSEKWGCIVKKN